MAADIPVQSLYIAGGVCGGVILVLLAILVFFCCCAPRRSAKRPDFESEAPHRRAQPIAVSEPQAPKPLARVHPTPSAPPDPERGVENFGAELADSPGELDWRRLCAAASAALSADPLTAIGPPPQYVDVTEAALRYADPPPAYPLSPSRRWQSASQLPPPVLLSAADLSQQQQLMGPRAVRSVHDIPEEAADTDDCGSELSRPHRTKRVVYEVVV